MVSVDWPGVLWSVLTGLVFVVSARTDWPGVLCSVLELTGLMFCGQC